jgi:predicted Zn-dependent protease
MAAALVGATGGKRRDRARAIPAPSNHAEPVEIDPAKLGQGDWLTRAREIARRSEAAASSRIVYRAAWLATDDDRVWAVGEDGDRHQRLVRSRLGATFVAWQGSLPQFGEVEVAGGFGPAVTRITDVAIARAAADALALFTPTPPPVGRQVVLLDPGVVAALVDAHVRAPQPALPDRPGVTIVEEPAVAGFARSWFDDDGTLAGRARRFAPDWRLRETPAQLAIAGGAATAAELERGINDGLVIEGVRDAHIDDAGQVVLRVTRGRQLTTGSRTGRQWGDLEVRGSAREMLSDAIGTSRERSEIAVSDTPARAVTAPWLLTRAHVGRARGAQS